MVTRTEIEQAKTRAGGWTREQLAEWGVPWPPPKGWRRRLERQVKPRAETNKLREARERAFENGGTEAA